MARTISLISDNLAISLFCTLILVFIVTDVRSLLTKNSIRVRKHFNQRQSFSPSSSSFSSSFSATSSSPSFLFAANGRGREITTSENGKLKKKVDQPELKKTIAELSEEKVKNEKIKNEKLMNEKVVKTEKVGKNEKLKIEKVKNDKQIPTDFIDGLPVKKVRCV